MKIPIYNNENYEKCFCGEMNYAYISRRCLHKLCESCFKKKFPSLINEYICLSCQKENKGNTIYKLKRDDFSNKSLLEEFYDRDKKEREKLMKLIYKRRENFESEEEYNNYLENVEKCLRKNNIKEIEKKYSQNINEKDENNEKRKKYLRTIEEKIRENSPTHYNNSKFIIDFEGNFEEEKELDPIRFLTDTIKYIPDPEKEKICGGYRINNIYQFLSNFSKGGLIRK